MERPRLDFLADRSDEAILAEIRRVAAECSGKLTKREFQRRSGKVSADTVRRRFGNWGAALQRAGLAERYAGPSARSQARGVAGLRMSDAEMLAELRRVHAIVGGRNMSENAFKRRSAITVRAVVTRFGSWRRAVTLAGVPLTATAARYTGDQLFANLKTAWDHLGRRPYMREMYKPPSKIGHMAYVNRWGTWLKAVEAFIAWNATGIAPPASPKARADSPASKSPSARRHPKSPAAARAIGPQLRYAVFERDGGRCVVCGRGPADREGVKLQVDHVTPVAAGGTTTLDNLQTLCRECNLGKSDRVGGAPRPRGTGPSPSRPAPNPWLHEFFIPTVVRLLVTKVIDEVKGNAGPTGG